MAAKRSTPSKKDGPKAKGLSLLDEFKAVAFQGNVIDLAVAVIIGAAFGRIVSSLVDHILMPLIGVVLPVEQGYEEWAVTVPDEYLSPVLGDVNSRREMIEEVSNEDQDKLIAARVPLAELSAYSTTLRSITSGRGNYSMEPEGYQVVPQSIIEKLEKAASERQKK